MNCVEARAEAAAALLTRSTWGDDLGLHVASCAECAVEFDGLRDVRDLLELARPGALPAPVPPDPALLDRLLAAASDARRRRRVVLTAAAGVVLLLVLAASSVVVFARTPSASTVAGPDAVERSASNTATGVSGTVALRPSPLGSSVDFAVSGVPRGTVCTLRVVTVEGSRQVAATWTAGYRGHAQVTGTVPSPVARIAQVDLVDASGHLLLRVPT